MVRIMSLLKNIVERYTQKDREDESPEENKYILVYGAGISGRGAAEELSERGEKVILYDDNSAEIPPATMEALQAAGGFFKSGNFKELLPAVKQIVLSPGVPVKSEAVQIAIKENIEVISEIELAWRNYPGHTIAITGTNGKTTTTMLIAAMLKKLPVKTAVGGNIGYALSREIKGLDKDSWLAAEVSSFQLEGVKDFAPDIALVLNFTPDHIERHGTLEEYALMKKKIFAKQRPAQYTIINSDDPEVRTWGNVSSGKLCYFSRKVTLPEGAFMEDGNFYMRWEGETHPVCHKDELKIFGGHNEENVLAAIAAAFFAGVKIDDIRAALLEFKPVEHRIEYVSTINGVPYYNDSKATNTDSAIKALEAFPKGHVILLAGGHDKMTDLSSLMQTAAEKTDALILLGEARERFYEAAQKAGVSRIIKVDSFAEAVQTAYEMAKPSQVVLLSPACSSYDMFRNYPERGRTFKQLVSELEKR